MHSESVQNLTMRNVRADANFAFSYGGAFYTVTSHVWVYTSAISHNRVSAHHGHMMAFPRDDKARHNERDKTRIQA